jgi:hypothetical protein
MSDYKLTFHVVAGYQLYVTDVEGDCPVISIQSYFFCYRNVDLDDVINISTNAVRPLIQDIIDGKLHT